MIKYLKALLLKISLLIVGQLIIGCPAYSQDFAPQAGLKGSTAIYKDSLIFIDWAISCEVHRGYVFFEDTTYQANGSNLASYGADTLALGIAKGTMDVVSLGDGGYAILSFHYPIVDGQGYDFAVFENGFRDLQDSNLAFLELAFVEVSPDGQNYYRFPSVCQILDTQQISTFQKIDARYIHNLAGKYIANYGTPFDLSDLKEVYPDVDLSVIRYVKIIDVIGAIDKPFTSYDYYGNAINDPYPTPFATGGFDLDAVGVIHNILEQQQDLLLFPNPTVNKLNIYSPQKIKKVEVISQDGKIIYSQPTENLNQVEIDVSDLPIGVYLVRIWSEKDNQIGKFLKMDF